MFRTTILCNEGYAARAAKQVKKVACLSTEAVRVRRSDIKLLCELDGLNSYKQAASGALCCRGGGAVGWLLLKIMKTRTCRIPFGLSFFRALLTTSEIPLVSYLF